MNLSLPNNRSLVVTVAAAAMGVLIGCGLARRPISPAVPQPTKVGIPFQVVDEEGKVLMEVRKAGTRPLLSLMDSKGKSALSLSVVSESGAVLIRGANRHPVVILSGDDGGQLLLYPDARSAALVGLGVGKHGGHVKLRSVKGTDMISLDVEGQGGRIQVRDASGKVTGQ